MTLSLIKFKKELDKFYKAQDNSFWLGFKIAISVLIIAFVCSLFIKNSFILMLVATFLVVLAIMMFMYPKRKDKRYFYFTKFWYLNPKAQLVVILISLLLLSVYFYHQCVVTYGEFSLGRCIGLET